MVVLEPAVILHQAVQHRLALVPERGMAKVMGERDRFGKGFIEAQGAGNVSGDGRDFDGMGEARPVMVAGAVQENLGFVFEAAKRP